MGLLDTELFRFILPTKLTLRETLSIGVGIANAATFFFFGYEHLMLGEHLYATAIFIAGLIVLVAPYVIMEYMLYKILSFPQTVYDMLKNKVLFWK